MGLFDSASKSGIGFATSDLRLGFGARVRDYVNAVELEAWGRQVEDSSAERVAQVAVASIGYEPKDGFLFAYMGRLKLAGADRVGSDLVTRYADDRYGRADALRLDGRLLGGDLWLGVIYGNTLGRYGASSAEAESSMDLDPFTPGGVDTAKKGRASIVYLRANLAPVELRLWAGQEKNYFEVAPTVSANRADLGVPPDGIVYGTRRAVEASVTLAFAGSFTAGAWAQKIWLKDAQAAVKKRNGDLETAATTDARSNWREQLGVGLEYDASGPSAQTSWFTGASVVTARAATDDLVKGSPEAKLEEDRDLTQLGVSVGYRDKPVIASLNAALNSTSGKAIPDKDATPAKKKTRTVIYSAVSFQL